MAEIILSMDYKSAFYFSYCFLLKQLDLDFVRKLMAKEF